MDPEAATNNEPNTMQGNPGLPPPGVQNMQIPNMDDLPEVPQETPPVNTFNPSADLQAQQTQINQAMLASFKALTDNLTSSTNASTTGSSSRESWGSSVDTKGIIKCDQYFRQAEQFMTWKRKFYNYLDMINNEWTILLKNIEENELDLVQNEASWSEEKRKHSKGIETFLTSLCKGDAETRILAAPEGNGFEAWRLLARAELPKSQVAAMNALTRSKFVSEDLSVNL